VIYTVVLSSSLFTESTKLRKCNFGLIYQTGPCTFVTEANAYRISGYSWCYILFTRIVNFVHVLRIQFLVLGNKPDPYNIHAYPHVKWGCFSKVCNRKVPLKQALNTEWHRDRNERNSTQYRTNIKTLKADIYLNHVKKCSSFFKESIIRVDYKDGSVNID
jgi:ribosomal protein S20